MSVTHIVERKDIFKNPLFSLVKVYLSNRLKEVISGGDGFEIVEATNKYSLPVLNEIQIETPTAFKNNKHKFCFLYRSRGFAYKDILIKPEKLEVVLKDFNVPITNVNSIEDFKRLINNGTKSGVFNLVWKNALGVLIDDKNPNDIAKPVKALFNDIDFKTITVVTETESNINLDTLESGTVVVSDLSVENNAIPLFKYNLVKSVITIPDPDYPLVEMAEGTLSINGMMVYAATQGWPTIGFKDASFTMNPRGWGYDLNGITFKTDVDWVVIDPVFGEIKIIKQPPVGKNTATITMFDNTNKVKYVFPFTISKWITYNNTALSFTEAVNNTPVGLRVPYSDELSSGIINGVIPDRQNKFSLHDQYSDVSTYNDTFKGIVHSWCINKADPTVPIVYKVSNGRLCDTQELALETSGYFLVKDLN